MAGEEAGRASRSEENPSDRFFLSASVSMKHQDITATVVAGVYYFLGPGPLVLEAATPK